MSLSDVDPKGYARIALFVGFLGSCLVCAGMILALNQIGLRMQDAMEDMEASKAVAG